MVTNCCFVVITPIAMVIIAVSMIHDGKTCLIMGMICKRKEAEQHWYIHFGKHQDFDGIESWLPQVAAKWLLMTQPGSDSCLVVQQPQGTASARCCVPATMHPWKTQTPAFGEAQIGMPHVVIHLLPETDFR